MQTYDSRQVTVIFGAAILTGYADGEFCTVTRDEENFTKYVGAYGDVTRARNANRGGRAKVRLASTSLSNDVLSAIVAADEVSGAGVLPFMVKDLRGTTLCLAKEAWIVKPADVAFDREVAEREWEFELGEVVMFIGGNT